MVLFQDLDLCWKVLIIIGFIFCVCSIILAIVLILIFETDIIPIESLYSRNTEPDLEKFNFLFDDDPKDSIDNVKDSVNDVKDSDDIVKISDDSNDSKNSKDLKPLKSILKKPKKIVKKI